MTLCVLGATGSIGTSTLNIVRRTPSRFRILSLTANSDVHNLARLAIEFGAEMAAIGDKNLLGELREALSGSGIRAAAGEEALIEAASMGADITVAGIMGAAGLAPTLAAVRRGKRVALANKECLVAAGFLFMREVRKSGACLLPVDSEHSAIFQSLDQSPEKTVSRIILTASGGPFRRHSLDELKKVTPEQALKHPNWSMGRKITIDSATMMNKGLELIEAMHLFPVGPEALEVVVHPQSIIHSMVAYVDGSVIAQMGLPDMRTPIAYALAWPSRMEAGVGRLDLTEIARLDFEPPDERRFPALALAREVMEAGGNAPTIMNAANEVAVEAFLRGALPFLEIAPFCRQMVERAQGEYGAGEPSGLDEVLMIDQNTRKMAQSVLMM